MRSTHAGWTSAKLAALRAADAIFAHSGSLVLRHEMNRELAREIYQRSHLVGDFLLRSGQRSNEYFDKYLFECEPALLRRIATELASLVPHDTEVIAGLELGGIPLATALGLETGIPMAFVRKKAKQYGTCKLAEGASIEGRRVLVVEDVVTSGGQVLSSITELRERGARIDTALCVIDRQQGGQALLAAHQVILRALFTMEQLAAASQ
jgi:orotate phosphoribosyltransferase